MVLDVCAGEALCLAAQAVNRPGFRRRPWCPFLAVGGRLGSLVSSTIPRPIGERHTDNGVLNFPKKGRDAEAIRKIAEAMNKPQTIKNPVDVNLRGS